jgi:hypothetical protein
MTINTFIEEDQENQARQIKQYGVYIDSYFLNDHLINVYSVYEFFVEVIINVRKSSVVEYVAFEKGISGIRRLPYGLGVGRKRES